MDLASVLIISFWVFGFFNKKVHINIDNSNYID